MTHWRHYIKLIKNEHHYVSGFLEMKSSGNEFIQYFTRENNHTSVMFPAEELSFQITSKNLERRKVKMSIHGNLVSESYKLAIFDFTVCPTPKVRGEPNFRGEPEIAYNIMLDKISPDIEVPLGPERIIDAILNHIKSIDETVYELNH